MILQKLIVYKGDGSVIRNVPFHKGLNLIVDDDQHSKGNNVGKTTVLRCIDFCLGSSGKNIYQDAENKQNDKIVYNFLIENDVYIELYCSLHSGETLILERGFAEKGSGLMRINGSEFIQLQEYRNKLNEIIFGVKFSKPSLRELMNKFIRDTNHKMSNILKFENPNTSDKDYEIIYLYLRGFTNLELLNRKAHLIKNIKNIQQELIAVKKNLELNTDSAIKQAIGVLENKIQQLENQISKFEIKEGVDEMIDSVKSIRESMREVFVNLADINTQLDFNKTSKYRLESELSTLDIKYVGAIYEKVSVLIPDLQKEFEDVMMFHSSVVKNRLSIIQKNINHLYDQLKNLEIKKNELLQQESVLLSRMKSQSINTDMDILKQNLKDLYEQKGQIQQGQDMISYLKKRKESEDKELKIIGQIRKEEDQDFEKNLKIFNKYFSFFSEKVFGVSLILHTKEKENNVIQLDINNLPGNVGNGQKKSQIAVFDFAYIEFLNEMNLPFPRFIAHDNLEGKDDYNFKSIFEIAHSINGQYIVPIIQNRAKSFMTQQEIDKSFIIKLNSESKFFKIEE